LKNIMKYTVLKGTLFFPLGGFFNEVTQIKKKFKKTLSQPFLFSQRKTKTKKQKQRLKASPSVGVARLKHRQDEAPPSSDVDVGVARRRRRLG